MANSVYTLNTLPPNYGDVDRWLGMSIPEARNDIAEGRDDIADGYKTISDLSKDFNSCLEQPSRIDIEDIVKRRFSPDAVIKLTLWKAEDAEPLVGTVKQYEIPRYLIGAFFRALLEDSLQSFSLRLLYSDRQHLPTPPSARAGPIVGYPATVCLAYANGIEVDMDGPLTVQLARCDGQDEPSCVITSLAFDARKHKVRAAIVDRRPRVPAECDWVINAFGMPPAAMRMLDMIPIMLPVIRMMGPNGLPVAWPGGAPWHNERRKYDP